MVKKRTVIIIICSVSAAIVLAGLGVLIWWLVTRDDSYSVTQLSGRGIGDSSYTAALTTIHDVGDMFWWFYPTLAASGTSRPLILWLDGVTGVPPSLSANLGMFGPYDLTFTKRNNSWVEQYNLLFVDAPLGTGFSTPLSKDHIPKTIEENAEHLATTLKSFYSVHRSYRNAPLYIFGQGYGAQLAVAMAIELQNHKRLNPRGVVIANGIISPALAMTKLGFYLEELGYIADNGRPAIEALASETSALVSSGDYRNAFDKFASLGEFVNENAGAVAVNLGHIVEKKTNESLASRDYFGQYEYLRQVSKSDLDIMNIVVAHALGMPTNVTYDAGREDVIDIFKSTFMIPATEKIEYLLQNTDVSVSIYNGNLDAVSNTPGQLEWVENLKWPGQEEFKNRPRQTLVVNSLLEGYFRETPRLKFYWMNAAGQSVPIDSPSAINVVLRRITET